MKTWIFPNNDKAESPTDYVIIENKSTKKFRIIKSLVEPILIL